ncbi:MAG: GGDEF domain-containing protein [Ruminiclostridium sp.]|nr:GGDEF domain-containing protein [Ruminiclostridium sp.]
MMFDLFSVLKKYNCIDIIVRTSGSVTLAITGEYDGVRYDKPLAFSDFVFMDDFPPLMDTINEFASSSRTRLFTHFRIEHDGQLHWAYMCCSKSSFDRFSGILLDVYEYIDCIPNDSVISEFERKQGKKISALNNNTASLLEICGKDYLKRIQNPFTSDPKLYTAILDENGDVICAPSYTEKTNYPYSAKEPVRFSFRTGAYWYIGSENEESVKNAEPYLKGLAECLSSIAHSIVALYNEAENSNAVNKQLGANVEQQMLINSMQSVIMQESKASDALLKVLDMAGEYLHIDGIIAFGDDTDGKRREFCRYDRNGGANDTYEIIKNNYALIVREMSDTENYFSGDNEERLKSAGVTAFAVSAMNDNNGVNGIIMYLVCGKGHQWSYNDRKMIRSISQVLSTVIFRCESEKQIEEKNKQLYDLAFFDAMLGIKNRSRLDIDTAEIIRSHCSGAAMAVQIINTRFLNEVFGQSYTDKLLRQIADFLSSPEIGGDGVYRYSGSIMMVIAKECTAEQAQIITKKILERIREPFIIDGIEQYAEAAIGIAVFNSSTVSGEDLYRAATLSLYRANEYGKNTFAFYNREFLDAKGEAFNLESELRRCIADNMRNFEVTFQPAFNSEGDVNHYETLLRWKSEKMGSISPRVFMRMMEKVGLDTSIDLWVLPRACKFCKQIREATGKDIKVSVNLTTHEMQTGALPERFRSEFERIGLTGSEMMAEVPEAAHIVSYNDTASTLGKLKRLGMSICIDSFGNEYLPLHVMKNSYVDMIKVSSSFVTNSGGEFDDVLLSTTFSLAKSKNITTSVKNVEYRSQLEAANRAGADVIQGGYLAAPATPEEILASLKISVTQPTIG